MILGFILLSFIGCGEGSSTYEDSPAPTNTPKSPVLENKEKIPPSIPNIY